MNIRMLRLKLKKLALSLEELDEDSEQMSHIPEFITNDLINLSREVQNEITTLKRKRQQEYERSPR